MKTTISTMLSMLLLSISGGIALARQADTPEVARGVVFHDVNADGKRNSDEPGLPHVGVSNGREVVLTDARGRYEVPLDDDMAIFVIKPPQWQVPRNRWNLPRFFYSHKPKGSPKFKFPGVAPTGPLPESVDFPLTPREESDEFEVILFGDTQSRNLQEVDYLARDLLVDLVGHPAAFGVTLGDITFDDLNIFEPQAEMISKLHLTWYNVIGNHDLNFDSKDDAQSTETFERIFGPAYYSFNYGPVHFIALDDIHWKIDSESGRGGYHGRLEADQLTFLENDLKNVPEEKLVVVMMHIPIMSIKNRQDLFRILETRPHCLSVSGHTHTHEHHYLTEKEGWKGDEPHHHMINVTACGSWWRGAPDHRGIPHAMLADGAPNGYTVLQCKGNDYAIHFRAAGEPVDHQMAFRIPEAVPREKLPETPLMVNFFNGCEKTEVVLEVDHSGKWVPMQKTIEVDPAYQALYDRDQKLEENDWMDLPSPHRSTHLWKAQLPKDLAPGVHALSVRATDPYGNTFIDHHFFRVTE